MNRLHDVSRKTWAVAAGVAMATMACGQVAQATVMEDPSGTITKVSGGPPYTYAMTLKDASDATQPIGTFWFAWVPGEDFLATPPISETSPVGWRMNAITNMGSGDGYAIQWISNSAASDILPGGSLSGFGFTTNDSPSSVDGNSVFFPSTPVLTSFVYNSGPFSDAGVEFKVTPVAAVPEPATLAMGLVPMMMMLRRKRRLV